MTTPPNSACEALNRLVDGEIEYLSSLSDEEIIALTRDLYREGGAADTTAEIIAFPIAENTILRVKTPADVSKQINNKASSRAISRLNEINLRVSGLIVAGAVAASLAGWFIVSNFDTPPRLLYEFAAYWGYAHAQNKLGVFYMNGLGGLPKDEREALRLFKLAADQGDAGGQVNLSMCYARGCGGLPKDERETGRLLQATVTSISAKGSNVSIALLIENKTQENLLVSVIGPPLGTNGGNVFEPAAIGGISYCLYNPQNNVVHMLERTFEINGCLKGPKPQLTPDTFTLIDAGNAIPMNVGFAGLNPVDQAKDFSFSMNVAVFKKSEANSADANTALGGKKQQKLPKSLRFISVGLPSVPLK